MKKITISKTTPVFEGLLLALVATSVSALPLPGGTLDPTTVPKYVDELVIPPVMPTVKGRHHWPVPNTYQIAVRQFQQQILPAGYPSTTVWSYGAAADPTPVVAPDPNSSFNYPAFTIEATKNSPLTVDWINDLKDPATGNFLPHLFAIDQTLHWANPGADCISGAVRTDCRGEDPTSYTGPVPIVTHVHGAHTDPDSDGYPEAWWLPDPTGSNFTCVSDPALADPANNVYVCQGSRANYYGTAANTNVTPGVANYHYRNDQPTTTLWYHDHSLGMTRNNVYAGPAGFYLIRNRTPWGWTLPEDGLLLGNLPWPEPTAHDSLLELNTANPVRNAVREIPVVIQDRSFNADGSLFYPSDRAFFEGLTPPELQIPFIPDAGSDISPIWNPEAFFNTMVVNGRTWPKFTVAPALYRLRLLNGCNSRFLNLSMFQVNPDGTLGAELPFYQIGTEQSLLPQVVMVSTGYATPLPGDGTIPAPIPAASTDQALLMGLAERADVIVDFRNLPTGTRIRMINTAPDAPFGGFPDMAADPGTTGQVMEFVVDQALYGASLSDKPTIKIWHWTLPNPLAATPPESLVLGNADPNDPAGAVTAGQLAARPLALLEEESALICVNVDAVTGEITQVPGSIPPDCAGGGMPFAPKAALLGTVDANGNPVPTLWSSPIVTNPALGATEAWDISNYTADAHPIHLHLVKFKVLERRAVGTAPGSGGSAVPGNGVQPWENGWKDTVISYPGETTTVAATFDIPGLYVWHCHIVEHEDNEMMVPYCVGDPNANGCQGL